MSPESGARRRRVAVEQDSASPVGPGLAGGQYRPLADEQVRMIFDASLAVLDEIGVEVLPSACREVWRSAGARVDDERNRVFVSPALVTQALATAAREVRLHGQRPVHDMLLGGTRVYLGTGGAAVKVLDLDGKVRPSRLADIFDIGRMVEALDNIHFYLRPVVARDVPEEALDLNTYYAALTATTKHVMGNSFSPESVREIVRLAGLIAGGEDALRERPFVSWVNSWIVSPLRYAPETVETLDEIVRQGMPVAISSAPQAGATSPVTLAGTLVQLTAEQLSGITYINLLRPGHPVLAGYVPSVADLRTGGFSGGSPEFALMNAAAAQIAQFIGVPIYNSSAISDSKVPDVQAGYEKGMSTATAALAGANYIHHSAGLLESLLTVAYEQFVIDDDINGSTLRLVRGIEVTDETIALDVIRDVCAGAGHFLGHPQTLRLMKSGYYYPHTADRRSRDDWELSGGLDMRERARQRAREMLEQHWPSHIPADVDDRMRTEFDILLPREAMQPQPQSAA